MASCPKEMMEHLLNGCVLTAPMILKNHSQRIRLILTCSVTLLKIHPLETQTHSECPLRACIIQVPIQNLTLKTEMTLRIKAFLRFVRLRKKRLKEVSIRMQDMLNVSLTSLTLTLSGTQVKILLDSIVQTFKAISMKRKNLTREESRLGKQMKNGDGLMLLLKRAQLILKLVLMALKPRLTITTHQQKMSM